MRRVARAFLTFALTVALIPLPGTGGGLSGVAFAAPVTPPLYSIAAFPDNPTSVWKPEAVIVAPDGDVIVADTGNHRIRVLSPAGALKASFGSLGSAPAKLRSPGAIALGADNLIYVADTGNSRVQVFERDGTLVRGWGAAGTGNGQFAGPRGIAIGPDGRVYVSDSGNARIQVFSAMGAFSEKWGSYGDTLPGQFYLPWGIAVDSAGFVYVVDTNKHHVRKYNPTNRATYTEWGWTTTGTPNTSRYSNPKGISIAPDGASLMIADWGNWRIERCTPSGGVMEAVGSLPSPGIIPRFDHPASAAVAADGTWFVADTNANRVQQRSPAGTWLAPWSTPSTVAPYLSVPEAVAADPITGVTYVADTGNSRVVKYSASGAYMGSIAETGSGPGQVSSPKGLLTLDDGRLLVSDTGNNRIQIYDASGLYQATFGAGVLSGPRALAVNSLGTLFVADTGNHRVAKFAPASGSWTYQSMIGTAAAGTGNGEFNSPRGVSVYGAYLYVADTVNNRIQKFNASSGSYLGQVGTLGSGPTQLSQPASVLVDGTGVLVADTSNHRLRHYDALLSPLADYDGADTRIGGVREPASLAAAPGGRTLVLERAGCRVQVLVRDATPPVTTISGVPSTPVRDATITFAATDPGSGVEAIYARTGGVTQTVTGPLVLSAEGTHVVTYWSVDLIGNVESEQTTQVVIDRTAPTGSMNLNSGSTSTSSTAAAVTSTVTGASQMRIAVDAAPTSGWQTYVTAAAVTLPAVDGTHTVYAQYRDEAGNVLALDRDIRLDTTGPTVTGLASATHPAGVPTWGPGEVTWSAPTDTSGIAGYATSIDSDPAGIPASAITTTSARLEFSTRAAGTWYAHVRAIDGLGNRGPVATLELQAVSDSTPPVTTATGVPLLASPGAVTVTLEANDGLSGPQNIYYRRGGGIESVYTTPLLFSAEGAHTLTFRAVDRAGNNELEQMVAFVIDYLAPVGTFTLAGDSTSTSSTAVAVTSAVEGASQMRIAVGAAPTSGWQTYDTAAAVTLPAVDGMHTVHAEYRDEAGNVLALDRDIRLDTTGPTVTGLASATHSAGVPTWGPGEVTWAAPTDTSGIAGYATSIDSDPAGVPAAAITTTSARFEFSTRAAGTWYAHIRASDGLGNWGPVATLELRAVSDSTPPVTTATGVPSAFTSANAAITLTAADAISGLAGIRYRKDGGAEATYTAPVAFTTEGAHTMSFRALDRAGNAETLRTVAFVIDRTASKVDTPTYAPYQSGSRLAVRWAVPADLSGVVGYAVVMSQSPGTVPSATVTTTTPALTFPASDGPRYIHIRALDAAGNWGQTVHFDTWPKPVRLGRPAIVRPGRNPRQIAFTVTGSVESSAAAGTVYIVLERRLIGGTWQRFRVIKNIPVVPVAGSNRATYTSPRQAFATPLSLSRGAEWRVRTTWTGNQVLRPAVSGYSVPVRVR